jgi:hypothetical protein
MTCLVAARVAAAAARAPAAGTAGGAASVVVGAFVTGVSRSALVAGVS